MVEITAITRVHAIEDPRSSAPQLLGIIKSLPDVIFRCVKRADGKIYWTLNEGKLAEEFHLTTDEIRDKPLEALFPPEVTARLLPEFERGFRGEAHEFTNELFGRYFKHYPQPVFGPDGRVEAVIGFISEVTTLVKAEQEIKKLNEELAQRVDDLAVANKELESFSYTVSHDLRTPLAAIDGHAQLVLASAKTPGPLATASAERIRAAVRRMDSFIEDILRLSRSTSQKVEKQPVDLGDIAREVAREIQDANPDRKVAWKIAAKAPANVDPHLIRSVLQNLLGNAAKYSAKRPDPKIEFGVQSGPPRTFFVRDNGPGFTMDEAARLFQAFHRLPGAQGFQGTGVGLATVRRIVQRHGGRIWAEGTPGKGATFFFTVD